MVEPFGEREKDGGFGKRPSQTIEGTATEVSIEPEAAEAPPMDTAPDGDEARDEPSVAESAPPHDPAPEAASDGGSTPPPPPPRTSPSELKSFFTHLAAGLVGGLIGVSALALAWGLMDRTPETAGLAALQQRLAKVESAPAPGGDGKAVAALDQRVAALEERKPQDVSELVARVSKLQASLDALAQSPDAGGSIADAAALDAKLGAFEQRIDGKIESVLSAQDEAQGKSIETVENELANLNAKLGALAEAKLNADEADLGPEVGALDQRITKLETMLPSLTHAIDRSAASAKSGTAAIVFANLREAVNSGRPYTAELAALNTLVPKIGDLGVLPKRADAGIPTVPALAEDLRALAQAGAAAPKGAETSFIDSVIASAKSAVRVRRVDATNAGDEPDARLARAEADLGNGGLAAAVKEVEALPPASREAFAAWLDNAQARLSADATLAKLETALLSSLSGRPGEAQP